MKSDTVPFVAIGSLIEPGVSSMNYFAHATAADRYSQSRPYFHPIVIEKVRGFLGISERIGHAVDVACGTGQSALALTALADRVTALDISESMLAHAPRHPQIEYRVGPAEDLQVADASAELMTVSLAFHWFDRERFLREAHRVLRPDGFLVIYWNDFHGQMTESPAFHEWYCAEYFRKYPTPPRDNRPFSKEDAAAFGFRFLSRTPYTNEIRFTPEQLVHYLTTHSNIIALVENGGVPFEQIYSSLLEEVRPLFHHPEGTFRFGGEFWSLSKVG